MLQCDQAQVDTDQKEQFASAVQAVSRNRLASNSILP